MRFVVLALVGVSLGATVGTGYLRTRVETGRFNDPNARCLYWRGGTITWNQSTPGTSDLSDAESFAAIQRSFARWNAVMQDCGSIALVEGPRSPKRRIGYDPLVVDNLNLVIFRDRDCDDVAPRTDVCWGAESCGNKYDCWQRDEGTLALTTSTYDVKSGEIYDSDIELNSANHSLTVSNTPCMRLNDRECVCPPSQACVQTDIENTMTHEVGHLVGLAHVNAPTSTMHATAPLGETQKREVDPGSASFICDAYPAGAPPKNCVLQPVEDELGPVPQGCSASGGPSLLILLAGGFHALLALHRLRRRSA